MSNMLEKQKQSLEIKPPKKYNIVISNDDFTTFEFVIDILQQIFNKNEAEAFAITKDIHEKGKGIVGPYPFEIAESKKAKADHFAIQEEHPLKLDLVEV